MTTSLGSKNSLRSRTGQRRGQRIFGSNFGSCCWQDNDLPLALCPKLLDEQFFNTSSILMHFGIWPSILKLRTVRLCAAKWHISSSAKDESSYPKKLKKNMTNSLGSATWNNTWIEFFKHPALPSQCGNLRWGFQDTPLEMEDFLLGSSNELRDVPANGADTGRYQLRFQNWPWQ